MATPFLCRLWSKCPSPTGCGGLGASREKKKRKTSSASSSTGSTRAAQVKNEVKKALCRTRQVQVVRVQTYIPLIRSKYKSSVKFKQLIEHLVRTTKPARVNFTGKDNMTALHFAVLEGEELCVKTLIAFGADINARNEFDMTPLDVAMENSSAHHLVSLLLSLGCRRGGADEGYEGNEPASDTVTNPTDPTYPIGTSSPITILPTSTVTPSTPSPSSYLYLDHPPFPSPTPSPSSTHTQDPHPPPHHHHPSSSSLFTPPRSHGQRIPLSTLTEGTNDNNTVTTGSSNGATVNRGNHHLLLRRMSSKLTGVMESENMSTKATSLELQQHIEEMFHASQTLKADEALAIAMQQQEITKSRQQRRSSSPSPLHPLPPLPSSSSSSSSSPSSAAASPSPSQLPPAPPLPLPPPHGQESVAMATAALPPPPLSPLAYQLDGGSRVLCMDGGGIRGLNQIDILISLEAQSGRRVLDLFDWIIGTSTGAIVALMLVYGKKSLVQIRQLYFKMKDRVFGKAKMGFAYNSLALEELLQEELGTELRMSSIQHPRVMVSAVEKSTNHPKLHYFNNCFGDEFSDELVWKVARYSSAAPMHFSECDNYVDGGVLANNPCDTGLMRIQKHYADMGVRLPISCVVSVGSGVFPVRELGSTDAPLGLSWLNLRDSFRRYSNLIQLLTRALVESETVAEKCRVTCQQLGIPFFRLSPHLDKETSPGEVDNEKLVSMIVQARADMRERREMRELVCFLQRCLWMNIIH